MFSLAQLQQFVPGTMTQDLSEAARAHAWAAGFNILSNFILVPRWGYWGAAWATLVSYGLALGLMLRSVNSLLPELSLSQTLKRLTMLAAASSVVALLLRPWARGAASALVLGLVSAAAVMLTGWALKLITREDLQRLGLLRPPPG
jgi:O-antigen/teichoic acid export membrane protein